MVIWIILLLLGCVIYFFIKLNHIRSRFMITLILLFLLFLFLSSYIVIKKNNIEVKSFQGLVIAGEAYFKWLSQVFNNTKTLIGNAIKMDWSPKSINIKTD